MKKEKIIQIVSDFNELREKIIDMVCLQTGIKCESVKSIIVDVGKDGTSVELYNFDGFSCDYFLTWEDLNDKI